MTRDPSNSCRTWRCSFHPALALIVCLTIGPLIPDLPDSEIGQNPCLLVEDGRLCLRVMSFNILQAKRDESVGHWDQRRHLVAEVINAFDPELLGLQEVIKSQADFLTEALPEYGYVGVGWLKGNEDTIQVAIFYRKLLFERLEEGHFWLSETPDIRGSKSWFTTKPRMVSWVKLNTRTEPVQTICFFTTHLTTVSDKAKRESANIIHERMKSIAGSGGVILTGDFNTKAFTEIYKLFLSGPDGKGVKLIDVYSAVHPHSGGNEKTYHGLFGGIFHRRIDWILSTRHFKPIAAAIDKTNKAGLYPSDHFPVKAVLEINLAQ